VNTYWICSRCIMDTTVPGIRFDADGVCNFCHEYDRRAAHFLKEDGSRGDRLRTQIERMKESGRGRKYDAIIGLSGGLDSTYSAYLGREMGLRLLAVHVDNGWDSDIAVRNVQNAVQALGVDLENVVLDWDEFRDLQLAFLRASVPNVEIPTDQGIRAALYRRAADGGIRWILSGGNIVTEGITPMGFGYINRDIRYIRGIHRRFGARKLHGLPEMGLLATIANRYVRGIRVFRILNFVSYDKQTAARRMADEVGWQDCRGKHFESVYTRFFQAYYLPKKFGFDKRRVHLSTLVCAGQLSRQEAVEDAEGDPYPSEDLKQADLELVCRKLGIDRSELDDIMALPRKSHRDYPSNHRLWAFARFLARRGIRLAT
jgi:N-acetyl sugar amidotransferase